MPHIDERGSRKTRASIPWWAWPHVLSLEAPLVAVLWQDAMARAYSVSLTPGTTLGLALAVWLIYGVDRWLDGQRGDVHHVDRRHAFYVRHSRLVIGIVIPILVLTVAWLAFFVVPEGILWQCAALGLLIGSYLATYAAMGLHRWAGLFGTLVGFGAVLIVLEFPIGAGVKAQLAFVGLLMMTLGILPRHRHLKSRGFPKEIFGSLLFSLGCSMSVQFFTMGDGLFVLSADTLLLCALFAMNLIGISCVENAAGIGDAETVPALWPHAVRAYPWVLVGMTVVSISWDAVSVPGAPARHSLSVQVAASLLFLNLLWWSRHRLSPLSFRVLADLAIIIPPAWMLASCG